MDPYTEGAVAAASRFNRMPFINFLVQSMVTRMKTIVDSVTETRVSYAVGCTVKKDANPDVFYRGREVC